MKKTITLLTLTLCLSLTAIAQKTDTIKGKPNTDTIVVPASAKFINIGGAVYNAQQMQQHVSITSQLQKLLPPKK